MVTARSTRSTTGRRRGLQAAQIPTEFLAESASPPQVAVLGLTFEAGTNDLRESPATRLIEALRERGVCDIRVHDPTARTADNLIVATSGPHIGPSTGLASPEP